jgi:hypothetical protein
MRELWLFIMRIEPECENKAHSRREREATPLAPARLAWFRFAPSYAQENSHRLQGQWLFRNLQSENDSKAKDNANACAQCWLELLLGSSSEDGDGEEHVFHGMMNYPNHGPMPII